MKNRKINLTFAVLAATSLLATGGCGRPQPLTADNDVACRDRAGNIVDDDFCEGSGGGTDGNGMLMFMMLSSNGYKNRHGSYPKSYNPKSYAGKTTSGFRSSTSSRGGFGSSSRGFSAGS